MIAEEHKVSYTYEWTINSHLQVIAYGTLKAEMVCMKYEINVISVTPYKLCCVQQYALLYLIKQNNP